MLQAGELGVRLCPFLRFSPSTPSLVYVYCSLHFSFSLSFQLIGSFVRQLNRQQTPQQQAHVGPGCWEPSGGAGANGLLVPRLRHMVLQQLFGGEELFAVQAADFRRLGFTGEEAPVPQHPNHERGQVVSRKGKLAPRIAPQPTAIL